MKQSNWSCLCDSEIFPVTRNFHRKERSLSGKVLTHSAFSLRENLRRLICPLQFTGLLRNYTVRLVFSRNQVLKVGPLVSNHGLSDEKWIQLSAGGAEIINVKNHRTSERSIACSHGCLIWVCSLSNLGRKVYFLPAQSCDSQPVYIYSFSVSRWAIIFPCTSCDLKVGYIAKGLRCPALRLLEKKTWLVPEDTWGLFKIFIGNWISENTLLLLSWIFHP